MHDVLSVELQVAATLYYLAWTSEYRTIGNLFGIAVHCLRMCSNGMRGNCGQTV